MVVDCHVHTRDLEERAKETIDHALRVARRAGVSGIFAMPNTKPPLTHRDIVQEYLRIARDANVPDVFFGAYMALTADVEQVKHAVETYRELRPHVVGFKLYAGHSTNNIGVIQEDDQRAVFRTLAQEGYDGVLAIHAEKEKHINTSVFDLKRPETHAFARPPLAEIESVEDMIFFADDASYQGKLHIAHISTPEAVKRVGLARREGMDISCGVTPHHLFFDYRLMRGPEGALYKMNPPLRFPNAAAEMRSLLQQGAIDWIETDHAPHTLGEKRSESCPSGIPALHAWPLFIEALGREGLTGAEIIRYTHTNVVNRFGVDLHLERQGVYMPDAYKVAVWRPLEELVCAA